MRHADNYYLNYLLSEDYLLLLSRRVAPDDHHYERSEETCRIPVMDRVVAAILNHVPEYRDLAIGDFELFDAWFDECVGNTIETARRIGEIVSNQPLTIGYNVLARTEFTAKVIAGIIGGNLINMGGGDGSIQRNGSGGLVDAVNNVDDWMYDHAEEEGFGLIVSHDPIIRSIIGNEVNQIRPEIWGQRRIPYSSAYFVGRLPGNRRREGNLDYQRVDNLV